LEGRNSTTELLPQNNRDKAKSSQKFTSQLLNDFITSRATGTSQKTIYYSMLDYPDGNVRLRFASSLPLYINRILTLPRILFSLLIFPQIPSLFV